MIGHASMRGVMEFMNDLLGVSISLGTVHNIHQRAVLQAITINDSIDLSAIRVGLHDEIFQGPQPVLTGIDSASTYCCWPPKTTATATPGRSICSTCRRGG
jgi:hypothetical protein